MSRIRELLRLLFWPWYEDPRPASAPATPDPPDPPDPAKDIPLPHVATPSGLRVVVSVGGECSQLPPSEDKCRVVSGSSDERDYACGHRGAARFIVSIYGEMSNEVKQDERCPECFLSLLQSGCIRCALCGLPIFWGEGVALYLADASVPKLDIGTRVGDAVIGCMRWDCCPSGGFYAGGWTKDGFHSAFGGQPAMDNALSAGRAVISNN